MDEGRGLGSVSNSFIPQNFPDGKPGGPDRSTNNTLNVHVGMVPELSRKRPYSFNNFPDNQKILKRDIKNVNYIKNIYINRWVKSGLVKDIRAALANGKRIDVDEGIQGGLKLGDLNKQLNEVIRELEASKDLSSVGKKFQEQAKAINADNPSEVAQIIINLSAELEHWGREANWFEADQNAERLRQFDTALKKILKYFIIVDTDEGYGVDSDLKAEWGKNRISPPKSVAIQIPDIRLADNNADVDEGYGAESDLESEMDWDDAEPEVQECRATKHLDKGPRQFWATTENLEEAQYYPVEIESVGENLPASPESIAAQILDTGLKDASTEIGVGEFPDPEKEELNKLREEASAAELRTRDADDKVAGLEVQAQAEAESEARELNNTMELLKKEGDSLQGDNKSQKQQSEASRIEVTQAGERASQAEDTAEALCNQLEAQKTELKEALADAVKLRSEAEHTKRDLENAHRYVDKLKQDNETGKAVLKDAKGQANEAEQRAREAKDKVEGLKGQVQTLQEAQQEAQAEALERRGLVERLKQELDNQKEDNRRLEADNENDRAKLKVVEAQSVKLDSENGRLNSNVEKVRDKQRQAEQSVATTKAKLESYLKNEAELKREVTQAENEAEGLRNDVIEKNRSLRDVEARLDEVSLKNNRLEHELSRANETRVDLEKQFSDVSNRASRLENENVYLSAELEKLRALNDSQREQLTALSSLKGELEEAKAKIGTLEKNEVENKARYESSMNVIKEEFESDRLTYVGENENYKEEVKGLLVQIENLGQSFNDLEAKLKISKGLEEKALQESSELKNDLREAAARLMKSDREVKQAKKYSENLQLQLDEKDQEIINLGYDKKDKESELRALKFKVQNIEMSNKKLTDQLNSEQNKVQEAESVIYEQRRTIAQEEEQYRKKLEQVEERMQDIESDLEEALSENSKLVIEKSQIRYDYGRKEEKLQKQVDELDEKVRQQYAMLDENERVNKDSQKELASLREINSKLSQGVIDAVKRQQRTLAKSDSAISDSGISISEGERVKELKWEYKNTVLGDESQILDNLKALEKIGEIQDEFNDRLIKVQKDLLDKKNSEIHKLSIEVTGLNREVADLKKNSNTVETLEEELLKTKSQLQSANKILGRLNGSGSSNVFKYLVEQMQVAINESNELRAEQEIKLKAYEFQVKHVNNGKFFNEEAQRILAELNKGLSELSKLKKQYVSSAQLVAEQALEIERLKKR